MRMVSFALVLLFSSIAHADQIARSEIDIVDGSTIRVRSDMIHIVGIGTSKLGRRAHCGLPRLSAKLTIDVLANYEHSEPLVDDRS
jgi:hypothetical protein